VTGRTVKLIASAEVRPTELRLSTESRPVGGLLVWATEAKTGVELTAIHAGSADVVVAEVLRLAQQKHASYTRRGVYDTWPMILLGHLWTGQPRMSKALHCTTLGGPDRAYRFKRLGWLRVQRDLAKGRRHEVHVATGPARADRLLLPCAGREDWVLGTREKATALLGLVRDFLARCNHVVIRCICLRFSRFVRFPEGGCARSITSNREKPD
jgi:hypothetical protein